MITHDIPCLVGDGCQMMKNDKKYPKKSDRQYRKVLDKNDPFDQLIMELGQKGVLDVCAVEITAENQCPEPHEYSRKPVFHRWRHTS